MGSLGFDGEDDGKKYKLTRKLLYDYGAVNHASVPRKLRSAIKKRGRESITPPLPISKKHHRAFNGVKTSRKKSKLNMKQGPVTKDEEEVAETLYALADMFSDATKTNKPGLDGEDSKTKPSTIIEDIGILKLRKESKKMNSTTQIIKFQSFDDAQQPELPFSKKLANPSFSGIQSNLSPGSRPKMPTLDMIPSCERTVATEQVSASGIQYDKHLYPEEVGNRGLFLSSTGALSFQTQRFPARFEDTNRATQPSAIENNITADKYPGVVLEPKKSWKRCSAHVYIARLVKVLSCKYQTEKKSY